MPKIQDPDHCSRCGKLLRQVPCLNCGGRGYRRGVLFWKKKTCEACHGSGAIARCPDSLAHAKEQLLAGVSRSTGQGSLPPLFSTRGKGGLGSVADRSTFGKSAGFICPVCKGSGCVKTMGSLSPCPACRPADHDRWKKTQMPPPLGHPWWKGSGRK